MNLSPFIAASYAIAFGLVLWMVVSTLVSARRVERQLRRVQDGNDR